MPQIRGGRARGVSRAAVRSVILTNLGLGIRSSNLFGLLDGVGFPLRRPHVFWKRFGNPFIQRRMGMAKERLDKLIASTGRWSRREVKTLFGKFSELIAREAVRIGEFCF